METAEQIVKEFAHTFAMKYYDEIASSTPIDDGREDFLDSVKKNIDDAIWVIFEAAHFHTKGDHLEMWIVDYPDSQQDQFWILSLNNVYIKVEGVHKDNKVSIVEPQTKTIIYFA